MSTPRPEKHKRKREVSNSQQQERPTKKPALTDSSKASLKNLPPLRSSIITDNSELAPVLIHTPGIQIPENLHLQPYFKVQSRPIQVANGTSSATSNKGIASTELLLQSSKHPKLDFLGREADDDTDSLMNHYVAVVDPEKQTWELIEVRKMTVRGSIRKITDKDESEEAGRTADIQAPSIRDQRNALTDAFGTKQSRRAAQSLAENALLSRGSQGLATAAESAILSSMPAEALAATESKATALEAEVQAAKPIPTPNLSASHPSDIYSLDALVPNGLSTLLQLPGLKEWQERIAAREVITTTSRYVTNRAVAIGQSGNTTHLQVLRFILVLLEFFRSLRRPKQNDPKGSKRLPPRDELRRDLSAALSASATNTTFRTPGSAANPSPHTTLLPDPIIDSLRRKFVPQGSYLSKTDITLLHTTMCALTLHIPPTAGGSVTGNLPNELATETTDLRDDLHIEDPVLRQYYRELGCRVDKPRESDLSRFGIIPGGAAGGTSSKAVVAAKSSKAIARLKVPPEFPKVSRGKRATRR